MQRPCRPSLLVACGVWRAFADVDITAVIYTIGDHAITVVPLLSG